LFDACGNPLLLHPAAKRPVTVGPSKPPPRPSNPKHPDSNADAEKKRPRSILKKRDSSVTADSRTQQQATSHGRSPQRPPPLKRSGSSAALLVKSSPGRPSSPPVVSVLERVPSFTSVATFVRRKPLVKSQSLEIAATAAALGSTADGRAGVPTVVPREAGSSAAGGRRSRQPPREEELREQDEEEEGIADYGGLDVVEPSKPKRLMKKLFQL
jgi:hypothetical protein